ncbi:hypothetical protein EW145_g7535, partial [Phellinidium pouzarii]
MPLLSPNESYSFQSALVDFVAGGDSEWSMYNDDHVLHANINGPLPLRQGSEILAKATKDLMSLDSSLLAVGLTPPFRPPAFPSQRFPSPASTLSQQPHRPSLSVIPGHTLHSAAAAAAAASHSQHSV